MTDKEKELLAREEALRAKEREIEAREKVVYSAIFMIVISLKLIS